MKDVVEGKIINSEGKRGSDRKRIGMIERVDLLEKERYGDLKRRAEDRQGWRDSRDLLHDRTVQKPYTYNPVSIGSLMARCAQAEELIDGALCTGRGADRWRAV